MNKNMMWGVVIVALIVGVFIIGYGYEKSKATSQIATQPSMYAKTDTSKGTMMKKQQDIMMMAQEDVTSLKGTLSDVSGGYWNRESICPPKGRNIGFYRKCNTSCSSNRIIL